MINIKALGVAKAQAGLEKKKLEIRSFTDRIFKQAQNLQKHLALDTPQYTGNTAANWQPVADISDSRFVPFIESEKDTPYWEPKIKGDLEAVDASLVGASEFIDAFNASSIFDPSLWAYKRTLYITNPAPLAHLMEEEKAPSGNNWRAGNLSIDTAVKQFLLDVLRM